VGEAESWLRPEERLAVSAAEQEDEPLRVAVRLLDAVGPGTTLTVSSSMTSRKVLVSVTTVTILPTWIFWQATWMPPREETHRI